MNKLPPVFWQGPIQDEWTDYNGHLRDAFYLLLFSQAGDALMERIGLGVEGRAITGHSLFTLECHLLYRREVKAGQAVDVRAQLLGHDRKRLHLYFSLHLSGEEEVLACAEQLWINVDILKPKATEFEPLVMIAVQRMEEWHRTFPPPTYTGRHISPLTAPVPT